MGKTGCYTFLFNCQSLGKILDLQNIIYMWILKDHAKNTMAFRKNYSSPGKTWEIVNRKVRKTCQVITLVKDNRQLCQFQCCQLTTTK